MSRRELDLIKARESRKRAERDLIKARESRKRAERFMAAVLLVVVAGVTARVIVEFFTTADPVCDGCPARE